MKVLLINPPSEQIIETWDRPPFAHLGLAYLGSFIRNKGINIDIIDAKFENLNVEQVIKRVRQLCPQIIGITAMTNYVKAAYKLAKNLKNIFPDAIYLLGGAHATALPKESLKEFDVFDAAVVGEGEETIFEIIESGAKNWNLIRGIAYRENGAILQNQDRSRIEPLDSLPFPAWDMFPASKTYPLITSRGCPFRCVFCMRMLGSHIRLRRPHNIVQEIKCLRQDYNIRHIPIMDEIFTIGEQRTNEICDLLIKEGLHKEITWGVNSRVTGVSYALFKKMYAAGCRKIDFGIESGNEDILKRIKKGITVRDAMQAVDFAKKARIKTHGLFILGHPDETYKTASDTIKLAVKLNTTYLSVGIMVPYPGTEVYEMAKNGQGGYRMLSFDWNDYNKQIGNALEMEGIDRKTLERLQIIAYFRFYLQNFRIIGLLNFLLSYKKAALAYLKKFLGI